MVTITNGQKSFSVSTGAYETIYQHQGFHIVSDDKNNQENENENENIVIDYNKSILDSILEKPIAQWTKNEVKQVSELKNIDISHTKSISEAKEVIKEFLVTVQ